MMCYEPSLCDAVVGPPPRGEARLERLARWRLENQKSHARLSPSRRPIGRRARQRPMSQPRMKRRRWNGSTPPFMQQRALPVTAGARHGLSLRTAEKKAQTSASDAKRLVCNETNIPNSTSSPTSRLENYVNELEPGSQRLCAVGATAEFIVNKRRSLRKPSKLGGIQFPRPERGPQWSRPPHADIATMQRVVRSAKAGSPSRLMRRRNTTLPASSRPTILQTFFRRSMPTTASVVISLLLS